MTRAEAVAALDRAAEALAREPFARGRRAAVVGGRLVALSLTLSEGGKSPGTGPAQVRRVVTLAERLVELAQARRARAAEALRGVVAGLERSAATVEVRELEGRPVHPAAAVGAALPLHLPAPAPRARRGGGRRRGQASP